MSKIKLTEYITIESKIFSENIVKLHTLNSQTAVWVSFEGKIL